MAKNKETEVISEEVKQPEEEKAPVEKKKKDSPLKGIIKSISELSQPDRFELYRILDNVAAHDRDKGSIGNTDASEKFDQTLNSL